MAEKIVKDSQGLAKELVNDCISRKAAIDEVINLWADKPFGNPALVEIKDCIEKLPPAQPETAKRIAETAQNVSDEDLISRKAAIDAIRASTSKYTGFMEMEMYTDDDAVEAIEALPSAQPERNRGKWKMDLNRHVFVCSVCGAWQVYNDNYCSNCGADMRWYD